MNRENLFWNIDFHQHPENMSEFWELFQTNPVYPENHYVFNEIITNNHHQILKAVLLQENFEADISLKRYVFHMCFLERWECLQIALDNITFPDLTIIHNSFDLCCVNSWLTGVQIFLNNASFDPSFQNNHSLKNAIKNNNIDVIELLKNDSRVIICSFTNNGEFHTTEQIKKLLNDEPDLFL